MSLFFKSRKLLENCSCNYLFSEVGLGSVGFNKWDEKHISHRIAHEANVLSHVLFPVMDPCKQHKLSAGLPSWSPGLTVLITAPQYLLLGTYHPFLIISMSFFPVSSLWSQISVSEVLNILFIQFELAWSRLIIHVLLSFSWIVCLFVGSQSQMRDSWFLFALSQQLWGWWRAIYIFWQQWGCD
jgi:hypothetical protein